MVENFPAALRDEELPLPPIPPPNMLPRVGAPVVASGNNAPRPATLQSTPMTPYTPVEYQRQAPTERTSPEELDRQRLSDFFFGMANSQSPSFFGAIGQAGQALSAADRQRGTAAREDRRSQAEESYRAAQIELQNRQLAAQADPNSPRNIIELAKAQADLDTARARLAQAQREPQGQSTLVETANGPAMLNMQTGQLRPLPEGVITPQAQQRQDDMFRRINQDAATIADRAVAARMRTDMIFATNPQAQETLREQIFNNTVSAQMQQMQSRGRPVPPASTPPTSNAPLTRYDIQGRPITQ